MASNIEVLTIDWLETLDVTDGWNIYGDKPKNAPDKYILVDRTGGAREAMVLDRAEILIEVYHKTSRLEASDLAGEIGDRIIGLEGYDADITHASINSIVNLDDTLAQYHRYQIYCDVYHRR